VVVYATEPGGFAEPDQIHAVRVAGDEPVVMGDWFSPPQGTK
jgi:hypothetical protein